MRIALVAVVALAAVGCASTRLVRHPAEVIPDAPANYESTGEVEFYVDPLIDSRNDDNRKEAYALMAKTCGGKYELVSEGDSTTHDYVLAGTTTKRRMIFKCPKGTRWVYPDAGT